MIESKLMNRRLSWDDARVFEKSLVEFFVEGEAGETSRPMEVASVTQRPAVRGGQQFSIVFRGPHEPLLRQGTYRVRHPALGDFALFVTPIGQSADATDYEACFSHVA